MSGKLKIIPLGGIGEIGKNFTVYEFGGDILVVDCGLSFPDEEMFGVDLVIPDFSYLVKHKNRIRALMLTHGHEDHIGAVPYFLRQLKCPIYCTRLTAGLIEIKLEEAGLLKNADIRRVEAGQTVVAGKFSVEFIRVNHSIADAVSFAITTELGTVVHTGDFKIDSTPVSGEVIDLARFGALGKQGVLALLSDSTNVERPGYAMSERKVGEALDNLFRGCESRIVVTTFASNVHRLQQVIDAAVKHGRKVAITGRSMENILRVSIQLDYIDIPPGTIIEVSQVKGLPKHKVCVITTGSQGEPMSALSRMAFGAHRQVDLGAHDRVIISASPIPGNEKHVGKVINELIKRGCEVIYERLADVHVSGHACQEELKLMLALTNPKYFMPVHGEYRMLKAHAGLAKLTGIDPKNIFIPSEIGRVFEISDTGAKFGQTVTAGRVLVDGSGVGDVGSVVLRDRKLLAEDGLVVVVITMDAANSTVVAGPDIITRGFSLAKEADPMMDELRRYAVNALDHCSDHGYTDWATIKSNVRNALADFLFKKTRRKPMILPIIMEL